MHEFEDAGSPLSFSLLSMPVILWSRLDYLSVSWWLSHLSTVSPLMSKVSLSSTGSSPSHQETKESCSQGNKIHCVCRKENSFKKLLGSRSPGRMERVSEMRGNEKKGQETQFSFKCLKYAAVRRCLETFANSCFLPCIHFWELNALNYPGYFTSKAPSIQFVCNVQLEIITK